VQVIFRAEQHEFAAAILGPGFLVVAGVHGPVLAVADGADAFGGNAAFDERLAQRQRAPFAQSTIVFLRAALVAVALDEQFDGRIGFQRGSDSFDVRQLALFDHRAVEIKMHRVRGERSAIREHALELLQSCQRAATSADLFAGPELAAFGQFAGFFAAGHAGAPLGQGR